MPPFSSTRTQRHSKFFQILAKSLRANASFLAPLPRCLFIFHQEQPPVQGIDAHSRIGMPSGIRSMIELAYFKPAYDLMSCCRVRRTTRHPWAARRVGFPSLLVGEQQNSIRTLSNDFPAGNMYSGWRLAAANCHSMQPAVSPTQLHEEIWPYKWRYFLF